MPTVYDQTTGAPVDLSPEEATAGVASGKYGVRTDRGPVRVQGQDGRVFLVDPNRVADTLAQGGYSLLGHEEELRRETIAQERAAGLEGSIKAGIRSGANQLLLGIPEAIDAAGETPDQRIQREATEQYHQTARLLGGAIGVGTSLLAGGGLFRGVEAIGQTVARGVLPAAELAEASLATRLAGTAVNYATQGAILSSPQALIQAVAGDPKQAAETLAWGIGTGALLGGAGELFSTGASALGEKAGELLQSEAVQKKIGQFVSDRTVKVLGGERSQINKLSQERIRGLTDFAHEEGLIQPGMTRKEVGEAVKAAGDKYGAQIGDAIDSLDKTLGLEPSGYGTVSSEEASAVVSKMRAVNEHRVPIGDVFPEVDDQLPRPVEAASGKFYEDEKPPVQSVPVDRLVATQDTLTRSKLASMVAKSEAVSELPDIVKFEGKYWINDGHNRIASQILRGAKTVRAHVVDLDASVDSLDKIGVQNFGYMRTGMREETLTGERAKFAEVGADNATEYALGKLGTEFDSGRPMRPVEVSVGPGALPELTDGRHRMTAASEAGAKKILARVRTYDTEGNVVSTETRPINLRAAPAGPALAHSDVLDRAIQPGQIGDALRTALDSPEMRMPMNADQASALRTVIESADALPKTMVDGRQIVSFRDAQNFVSSLRRKWVAGISKAANEGGVRGIETVTALDQMKASAYQVARDAVHQAADRVAEVSDPKLVGALAAAKQKYAKLAEIEKWVATRERQAAGNRMVGLTDRIHMGQGPATGALHAVGTGIGAFLGGVPGALVGGSIARVPGIALDFLAKKWMEDKGLVYLSALAHRAAKEGPQVFSAVLASEAGQRLQATLRGVQQTVRRLATTGIARTALPASDHMSHLLGATSGLSTEQQHAKLASRLTTLASSPSALASATAQLSAPFAEAAPELGEAYQQQLARSILYLYESLPKSPNPPVPFAPDDWTPSPAERLAFDDKLEMAHNPMRAMDHIEAGTLSQAHLDALENLWSSTVEKMRQEVVKFSATHPDVKLPLPERQSLATFMRAPLDASDDPTKMRALQASYTPQQPSPASSGPSQPGPKGKLKDYPSAASAFSGTQGMHLST